VSYFNYGKDENDFFCILSERRNTRNTRDRLLEEQNAAYLDSVRADQEKVCYFEKKD
jgi:hypothetical protein